MIEQLLQPFAQKRTSGNCQKESESFEELDVQMMKYGSLHQGDIEWERVEQLCCQILQNECKHFRVVVHLITCWLLKRGHQGLCDSMHLLVGLLNNYWSNGYPSPGNAGISVRRKIVVQAVTRIKKAADKRLTGTMTAEQIEELASINALLVKQLKRRKVNSTLPQLNETLAALKPSPTGKDSLKQAGSVSGQTQQATPVQASDPGGERQRKKQLLELSGRINADTPEDPLGYALRRYALWSGIQSSPPANAKGESELMPPPGDVIAGYEEQLNDGNAGPELLIKIENSVAASPFWISGSLLTGQVAEAMGYQRVADSIRYAVENLLKRLPQIREGRFRGGLSFLDARRQTVGRGEEQPPSGNVAAEHILPEWNALQTELDELYLEQGIAAVLETIDRYQREAGSPRESFYLKLMAGERMHQAGLSRLMQDMIAAAAERVGDMQVSEWEPEYLVRLEHLMTKNSNKQGK